MRTKDVKVTTTSGFDGVEIIEYMEPITAHVVVGMNLFKDFLAGLSDIFGGRSNTYQNTLASINDDAINELRKKAFSLGANCILGLKIDNDEISSQNKSMLMVTAVGTAAKANFSHQGITANKKTKPDEISLDKFDFLRQKKMLLINCENNKLKITDDFWDFAISNQVSEFADHLIFRLKEYAPQCVDSYQLDSLNKFTQRLADYFNVIDIETSTRCLYDSLNDANSQQIRDLIIGIISDIKLVDYDRIIKLVKDADFDLKKNALQILKTDKISYSKSDILRLITLVDLIRTTFKERGTITTKKKALLTKEKEIWICECGKENDIEQEYCSICKKDFYGFYENEMDPAQAIEKIENEMDILKKEIE